jgi:hypothetical protein
MHHSFIWCKPFSDTFQIHCIYFIQSNSFTILNAYLWNFATLLHTYWKYIDLIQWIHLKKKLALRFCTSWSTCSCQIEPTEELCNPTNVTLRWSLFCFTFVFVLMLEYSFIRRDRFQENLFELRNSLCMCFCSRYTVIYLHPIICEGWQLYVKVDTYMWRLTIICEGWHFTQSCLETTCQTIHLYII